MALIFLLTRLSTQMPANHAESGQSGPPRSVHGSWSR